MTSLPATTPSITAAPIAAPPARASRATVLCLVVHDELELRLRLASLLRRANPRLDADTVTRDRKSVV